jgi:hypothetical protein
MAAIRAPHRRPGFSPLVIHQPLRIIDVVNEKSKWVMPALLMLVFAITRWPGLMPPNFSAAYGLAFCAGVYFTPRLAWWLPMVTFFVTDVVLNVFVYHTSALNAFMFVNYLAYAAIILFGQRFKPRSSWLALLSGGLVGALLFYFLTNTASWILDPLYPKTLAGWIQALTVGTPGWPHTWEFFRNTLLSGGLFTGLFAGAMRLGESSETSQEEEEEPAAEEPAPEESKA